MRLQDCIDSITLTVTNMVSKGMSKVTKSLKSIRNSHVIYFKIEKASFSPETRCPVVTGQKRYIPYKTLQSEGEGAGRGKGRALPRDHQK